MRICVTTVLLSMAAASVAWCDEPGGTAPSSAAPVAEEAADATEQERRFRRFEELLHDAKLVGRFTILGKEDGPLRREEYTINRVTKLPDGDQWLFNTRIKYGAHDVQVPLPLDVKWAGGTPVITLTDFSIPGLGTFSARVVIYHNKYAGTWSHGEVGGHLFGTIEKNGEATEAKKPEPDEPKSETRNAKSETIPN